MTTWNDIQSKTFSGVHIGKTEIRSKGLVFSEVLKRVRGRTLDVGSGDGGIVAALAKAGVTAEGLDFPDVARVARERNPSCLFHEGSVEQMVSWNTGQTYDTALSMDVIEHVEDDLGLLRCLSKVAPRVIITTPSHPHKWRAQPEHLRWYPPVAMARLLSIAGMVLVEHLTIIEEDTSIYVAERSDLHLEERLKKSVDAAKDPVISAVVTFNDPVPDVLAKIVEPFLDYYGPTEIEERETGVVRQGFWGRRK